MFPPKSEGKGVLPTPSQRPEETDNPPKWIYLVVTMVGLTIGIISALVLL